MIFMPMCCRRKKIYICLMKLLGWGQGVGNQSEVRTHPQNLRHVRERESGGLQPRQKAGQGIVQRQGKDASNVIK